MSYNRTETSEDDGLIMDLENTQDLQEFIRILSRGSALRSKKDLRILYKTLKPIPFFNRIFKSMSEDFCENLLRELKYKYFPRAHSVFQAGTQETHLYVVLKGSTYILQPPGHIEKFLSNSIMDRQFSNNGIKSMTKHGLESTIHLNVSINCLFPEEVENKHMLGTQELLCEYLYHKLVRVRREKEQFGSNTPQFQTYNAVTAVCREACHLLTLSVATFQKLIMENKRKLDQDQIDFFKSFPLMADWNNDNIYSLKPHLKFQTMKRNQVIYDVGEPVEYIYFIKNGEIEMIQEKNTEITGEEFFMKTAKSNQRSEMEKTKLFEMNAIWKKQFSKARKQNIKVALLGAGQSFGEEELFSHLSKRKSKLVVKSATVDLIIISIANFIEYGNIGRFYRPKSVGMKNTWRTNLENNVIEMHQKNEAKARELKSEKQKIDLADIPKLFIKKEDRLDPKRQGLEPTKLDSPLKAKHAPVIDIIQPSEMQMNPLMKRRLKTPNRLYNKSPPKSDANSPRGANTERNPSREGSVISRAKLLRSAVRTRSRQDLNNSPLRVSVKESPRTSILEGSPASVTNLQRKPSYISFVQQISPTLRRTQSTQFESLKIVPIIRESLDRLRSPDVSPIASLTSTQRGRGDEVNSQNLVHSQNVSRDETGRKKSNVAISVTNSRLLFDKASSPLAIHTTQTQTLQSPMNSVFFKAEIKPSSSANRTPERSTTRSRVSRGEPVSFAQAMTKVLSLQSKKEPRLYSSKAMLPSTLFARRQRREVNL